MHVGAFLYMMYYPPKSPVSNQSSSQPDMVANNCTAEEFVATLVCRQTKAISIVVLMNEYKYFAREMFFGTSDEIIEEDISASLNT